MRVVSLVPSLSETVAFLCPGVLAGVTRYCVFPENLLHECRVTGGTKDPDCDLILSLKPDLVIANREENRQQDIEQLRSAGVTVLVTEIQNVEAALYEIMRLSDVLNSRERGEDLVAYIKTMLPDPDEYGNTLRAAYYIWRRPWMAAGGDTFISDMMVRFGLINVAGDQNRYPELPPEHLAALQTDCVLLSSEPYAFGTRHIREIPVSKSGQRTLLVDGTWFSWYGSRLLTSLPALAAWRHRLNQRV
jgi:ABC-type Fe3+-hydroxamate transport system substrate-binding protein